jgi:uncharacterized membrane protein
MSRRPRPARPAPAPQEIRQPWLDALRGLAVLLMIAYHFGFDLDHLGWIEQDINHSPAWQAARTLILGSFLYAVGASHALAEAHATPSVHLQRLARIAAAALLVTLGSALMFPASTIWFGVLHAIVAMSLLLLALPTALRQRPAPMLLLATSIILVGNLFAHPLFDSPTLAWIGLMSHKPQTEDYVPLMPWAGLCLIGYSLTRHGLESGRIRPNLGHTLPGWLQMTGRHSLAIYLLHQPLLLGLLMPLSAALKPA